MKKNSGYVLITILGILPVFAIAVLCVLVTLWFVKEKETLQYNCEKHNLIAQQILIDGAYDLIELNGQVIDLVLQKEQLEFDLKVAQGPERIGIMLMLAIVRARMWELRGRQKLTIKTAEARALAELNKITVAAHKQMRSIQQRWGRGSLLSRVRFKKPRMQVTPGGSDPSLPTYSFAIGYKWLQTIDVRINAQGASPLPPALSRLLPGGNVFRWRESCSTQPRQERGVTWQSYLSAGKLW